MFTEQYGRELVEDVRWITDTYWVCQVSLPGREWGQVKSIQEKRWYECLNSLRDRTVYERRQIFSTDKSTSLPTGNASLGHTGREAGKGHGNEEVWSWKRKGDVREWLKGGGCVMLLYVQEYDASAEGSSASACRTYGTRGGPASVHETNSRWHLCHLPPSEWTMLCCCWWRLNLIKVQGFQTRARCQTGQSCFTVLHDQQSGNVQGGAD